MPLNTFWKWVCWNLPAARMQPVPEELLNLCQLLRRAPTPLLVSWKQWSCHLCGLSCRTFSQNGQYFSLSKEVLQQLWLFRCLSSVRGAQARFLAESRLTGPCLHASCAGGLGAQPRGCGKAKGLKYVVRIRKGNNRISGTIWAAGTGNSPVLGEDFGICYPPLSPGFPKNVMHPYYEPDQNVKLIFRHFTGI